jgi:hypothetical protein
VTLLINSIAPAFMPEKNNKTIWALAQIFRVLWAKAQVVFVLNYGINAVSIDKSPSIYAINYLLEYVY